jgi:hypothetical protein
MDIENLLKIDHNKSDILNIAPGSDSIKEDFKIKKSKI